MITSITANVVHSIDAECLKYLISIIIINSKDTKYNKYLTVFTIHDCFMFPAPIHDLIIPIYKNVLINMNLPNRIKQIYKENNISNKEGLDTLKDVD